MSLSSPNPHHILKSLRVDVLLASKNYIELYFRQPPYQHCIENAIFASTSIGTTINKARRPEGFEYSQYFDIESSSLPFTQVEARRAGWRFIIPAGRVVERNLKTLELTFLAAVVLTCARANTSRATSPPVAVSTGTEIRFGYVPRSRERHRCHKLFSIYVVVLRRRSAARPSTNCSYGLSPSIVRGQTHAGADLGGFTRHSLISSYFEIALEYNGKQIATWLLSSGKESAFGMGENIIEGNSSKFGLGRVPAAGARGLGEVVHRQRVAAPGVKVSGVRRERDAEAASTRRRRHSLPPDRPAESTLIL
ncbi:hypothetical protein EVAR_99803_1 [Eumeta japonica]|uniref:Uncharacterized protein n=1 Tax=Eumeta variegata TaxID=151549 RepID=A0A4C1ZA63_EUMVA|nr:hypothetical protein EVAR_99803_1 [Eumeta japonica]